MHAPRNRGALVPLVIGALALLFACKSSTEPKKPVAALLSVSGGSNGLLGTSVPVTVVVRSAESDPIPNVTVTFQVTKGSATVSPATATTDANGQAQTTLTFGSTAGEIEVTISVLGTSLTRVFQAAAIAPFGACNASVAASLTPGEVRTPIVQLGVCISGGASGAEFAVVPFNNSTTFASIASLNFVSNGATTVSGPALSVSPPSAPSTLASAVGARDRSLFATPATFDARLRESERRVLARLMPAARAWGRGAAAAGSAAFRPSFATTAAPLTVGQQVQLNVRQGASFADACQTSDLRTGRVVAVTERAAVVADVNNPAGGFTDAEYQSIGVTFDTLVYPLDTQNFGTPSDIDSDGKIILFFSRAVNELTPRNSQSVVGGFFYGRDLFPKAASGSLDACPTSNVAEMFYLLVPDPTGLVNGNIRTKAFVSRLTISTTAHEFQHLINASRRLYVNTSAKNFEEVWLNEGLSHIAEELLFFRESEGLAPRMNIDSSSFSAAHQKNRDAFFNDQQSNFLRYRSYLQRPPNSSPYAPDDSLWTRGATWSFLRYAADHRGTADGDLWFQLVNSTTEGMNNLQNVLGSTVPALFRDWATSALTDDVPGVGARWQQPSWNQRSVYVYFLAAKTYPLATLTVGDGAPLNVSLNGGGVAFVRFAVAAGGFASVQWDGPPPNVAMTLVRMK